jgi:hypothetical protein
LQSINATYDSRTSFQIQDGSCNTIRSTREEPNLLNLKHLIIVALVAILLNPVALFAQATKVPDTAFSTDYDAYIRKLACRSDQLPQRT